MGMQIKINDNELREITGTLSEIRQRFKTVTTDARFLRSVGQLLVSRAKQNLEDGGTPEKSYDLLKPATQRQKSRLGYSLKPLQRTGLMKRSLAHEISGGLKLTGLDIIKHHQWGAPRAGIVARPVFTVETPDTEDIQDFLIRRFKQLNPNLK